MFSAPLHRLRRLESGTGCPAPRRIDANAHAGFVVAAGAVHWVPLKAGQLAGENAVKAFDQPGQLFRCLDPERKQRPPLGFDRRQRHD